MKRLPITGRGDRSQGRTKPVDPDEISGENDIREEKVRRSTTFGPYAALRSVGDMLTGTAVFRSYVDPDTQ